ncbi:MAG TPA: hypothetical protein VEY11_00335 [Pyrinomonadaceae bacterium]|nr:hypothetical protein [Pyrinomonadaceae bacterium]
MKRKLQTLCALTVVCFVVLLSGCAALNSKELTRSRALDLLRAHKEFKAPKVLPLRDVGKFNIPAMSEDEEPVPYDRAIATFFDNYPDMGVLRELGLVEAEATLTDRPQAQPRTGIVLGWRFSVDVRLTGKGRQAVEAAGGKGEDSFPLLRKEALEVSGVTKLSNTSAQADFTWKSVPTPIGEAFDPTSEAFRRLPEKLQKKISQPTIYGDSLKLEFGKTWKTVSHFQLYDDGWRVDYIQ